MGSDGGPVSGLCAGPAKVPVVPRRLIVKSEMSQLLSTVEVDGATVGELLQNLTTKYAGLKQHLYAADGKLRERMGRNGKEYVKRNYRWDAIMSKYDRLIGALRK